MTLTKPPSPYRERFTIEHSHGQTAGNAVKATGVITCVTKANFADTDYFTMPDGVNAPLLFEFDKTGDNVTDGTLSTEVAASAIVTCGTKAQYIDHEDMIQFVDEYGDNQELYEADPAGDGVPSGIAVDISGATSAIDVAAILGPLIVTNSPWLTVVVVGDGTITLTHKRRGAFANLVGMTENVSDGAHIVPANLSGGLDEGGPLVRRVQVDISGATTEADCAALLKTALEANLPAITVVDPVDGTLTLTHDISGTAGNVTITENVTNAGFTVSGLSGGLEATGNVIGDTNVQLRICTRPFKIDAVRYVNSVGLAVDATHFFTIKVLNEALVAFQWSTETTVGEGALVAGTWVALVAGAGGATAAVFAKDEELDLLLDEDGTAVLPPGRIVLECSYL